MAMRLAMDDDLSEAPHQLTLECPVGCIYLEVSVINPITRKESHGELVTTYAIYIETNDSAFTMSRSMVRRRYSEFVVLRTILQEQHPSLAVPRLPGRTLLGKRFDQRFIQDRCSGLQSFLKAIVEQPVYLSNKSLHLFLQTSLTMEQVQNVVNGCESFELPHNNSLPFVLYPVDSKTPNQGGRVGILKRETCASLASCPEHECQVRGKHQHMRVGSGIVVCPYSVVLSRGSPSGVRAVAGSAPFNIPAGSPKPSSVGGLRSCASDTCLDGAATGPSSFAGSKKRVSFYIEKENQQSLLRQCEAIHKDSHPAANTETPQDDQQQPSHSGRSSSPAIGILTERSQQDSNIQQGQEDIDERHTLDQSKDESRETNDSEDSENNNAFNDLSLKAQPAICSEVLLTDDDANCESCIQVVVGSDLDGVAEVADVVAADVIAHDVVG